jgi:sec-independent protein translocase protein TatC
MFLSLGLYQFEFAKLKLIFQVFIVSWILSSILLFKLIVPFSWNFFLSFQENLTNTQSVSLFFEAKLSEYLQYFINLYYVCLASCQFLAVLVIILTNLSEKLKKTKTFRKLFYLIFIIFSTIVTPPDILSQIIISCTLILIYEFLIFLKEVKINVVTN